MLPSIDAAWVGAELARRFGLPVWQMAMTATDANRFVLRFARQLTGRRKVLVFDWCYHGSVDEALATLDADGRTVSRPGNIGPAFDPSLTTVVVPFNDLAALEAALATGRSPACSPSRRSPTSASCCPTRASTPSCARLTRAHGTLLVIDETHTICAGPGGATAAWGLEPDFFVIGKTIGGGMPAAAYGMSAEVAERLGPIIDQTRSTSAASVARSPATRWRSPRSGPRSSSTLRDEDFAHRSRSPRRGREASQATIDRHGLPWHVQQLGCRAEYWFCPPPRDGAAAAAAIDEELDAFMHLWALNRGILLTPFHNMALLSPHHTAADVAAHDEVFAAAVEALMP